jgi:methylated-DNA-protein-cysteine methyltransferase-like protein
LDVRRRTEAGRIADRPARQRAKGYAPRSSAHRRRACTLATAIPAGFVRAYADIDPGAPRLVGLVLSRTHAILNGNASFRADGSLPKGAEQQRLLLREGVPMRGDRVDLREARLPHAL